MLDFYAVRVLVLSGIAFLVAIALTPLVGRLIKKYQTGKQIRDSKDTPIFSAMHAKKAGTPTMGGVIIWGSVLGLALLFFLADLVTGGRLSYLNFVDRAQTYLPLAAMAIAAFFGLIDDVLGVLKIGPSGGGIKIRQKLIFYTLIAAVGAWWFYAKLEWTTLFVPFVGDIAIGWLYIPFFMFIIIASAFSANETDGLDGLLGGVSLFAFAALTVVAFMLGRYDLAAFSGMVVGALLAFLWFNIYPAQFFMGDTGSMALGITMGVIAMLTNTALLLPLFAMVMVIESLSVIIQVTSKKFFKRKVFLSAPVHHHFEALGWPETQVTMRFWILSSVCAALGLIVFFLGRM